MVSLLKMFWSPSFGIGFGKSVSYSSKYFQFQQIFRDKNFGLELEIKLLTSIGSSKEHENSRKTSISALLTMPKPLTVWITTNCRKFLQRWEYQTTWPAFWEICMQVRKQQLELDMEQQTGSKLAKEYVKAVYCHPAYLTYMQSTSWDMLGWKHKLESRLLGEISTSDMQMRNRRRTKEPLDESERGEWKSWLKAQHSEN